MYLIKILFQVYITLKNFKIPCTLRRGLVYTRFSFLRKLYTSLYVQLKKRNLFILFIIRQIKIFTNVYSSSGHYSGIEVSWFLLEKKMYQFFSVYCYHLGRNARSKKGNDALYTDKPRTKPNEDRGVYPNGFFISFFFQVNLSYIREIWRSRIGFILPHPHVGAPPLFQSVLGSRINQNNSSKSLRINSPERNNNSSSLRWKC